MSQTNGGNRPRNADLLVDANAHPGWVRASERLPLRGETVLCTEGAAAVVRILGKTDSGGRLLELSVSDGRRQPFFAAAENVMVAPTMPEHPPALVPPADARRPAPPRPSVSNEEKQQ
jgi:hypothetical protein